MKLSFSILDKSAAIEQKILKALTQEIKKTFNAKNTISEIQNLVIGAIQTSPEYQSMVGGILQAELGIPDPVSRLSRLLDIWIANTRVSFSAPVASGSKINGQLKIEMIKADLSDVNGSDISFVIDANTGKSVYWLEWLTLAGDKTIIKNYDVILGPNRRSRTGFAIMRQVAGGRWKVPSEFAGTINNNWITRSIDSVADKIENLLERAFD